jgi:hypothetical protein
MTTALLERLHTASHNLDAAKVAKLMGVSLKDIATTIGVKYPTLKARTDAPIAQPGLQKLVDAWEMLDNLFAGHEDHIRAWIRHPLRRFRGETALWLMREHGADSFQALVEEMAFGTNG